MEMAPQHHEGRGAIPQSWSQEDINSQVIHLLRDTVRDRVNHREDLGSIDARLRLVEKATERTEITVKAAVGALKISVVALLGMMGTIAATLITRLFTS
jgi:hypothetical protein